VYATHNGPLSPPAKLRAALLYAGPGAVLSHTTAASLLGLRPRGELIHVLVPPSRFVRAADDVVVHRTRHLPAHHCMNLNGFWTTSPARTAVDCWGVLEQDDAVAVLAGIVQRGHAKRADLEDATRHPVIGRRRLVSAIAEVCGGSHSPLELRVHRILARARVAPPVRQHRVVVGGRTRCLDGAWPELSLGYEVDGRHHMERDQWHDDLDRQNELLLDAWLLLRFTSAHLREPDRLVTLVRRAIAAQRTRLQASGG
jgi:very-short-patch-repair endonuclease